MASTLQTDIAQIMGTLRTVQRGSDSLRNVLEKLRYEMEIPTQPNGGGGVGGFRTGAPPPGKQLNWRSGVVNTPGPSKTPYHSRPQPTQTTTPSAPVGRYQSKFVCSGSIDNKILNTVIGNKLNAFTQTTYSDTRDFIYQILDSGETEFIRDFLEKVFQKATVEDLYCSLFAKLIAEIAHKYPVMYGEMRKYHREFLKIFDDVQESGDRDVKKRQYRMGYGQFISELAGQNALEMEELIEMVNAVGQKIWLLSGEAGKLKTVEECIDCLTRLSGGLKERSPKFFKTVKEAIKAELLEKILALIDRKAGDRPSLSPKARYGLMDLRDILVL